MTSNGDDSGRDGAGIDEFSSPPTVHTPDFTAAAEPFMLFEAWFSDASAKEINDPEAMALATVDGHGLPNLRMVLMKQIDGPGRADRGFVFYTNLDSAKGRELAGNAKAALLFHWKSLRRQVRVRGLVQPVTHEEADAYFDSRARGSRLGAWASRQSQPLESRFALEKAVAVTAAKYPVGRIPRPPHWSGFRIVPVEIEFWADQPFRLHDRLVFRRDALNEPWHKLRLYP